MIKSQSILQRARKAARAAKATAGETIKELPVQNKLGLGLGVTSLGVSLAGYHNSSANVRAQAEHRALEQKSLHALNKIHTAISASGKKATGQQ